MSQATKQLPQYRCHKQVYALKIHGIDHSDDGSAVITPADEGYGPFAVDAEYVRKHEPKAGG